MSYIDQYLAARLVQTALIAAPSVAVLGDREFGNAPARCMEARCPMKTRADRLRQIPAGRHVVMKQEASPTSRTQNAMAVDALQEARGMPPGAQRAEALKQAGLLRRVADSYGLFLAKRGRPRSRQVPGV
jgi:hypothetical protein